jgi:FlgN protein
MFFCLECLYMKGGVEVSAQELTNIMEKLLKLHHSFLQLSKEKTDILKKGDMDALQLLLRNEQKHISAISIIDKERQKTVAGLFPGQPNLTITECIPQLDASEQEKIVTVQEQLIVILEELKDLNQLNQQLIQQSLQFVNLQLDLLLPNELDNYSKEQAGQEPMPKLSIFDSKA